ncbi:MAG TPA: hypothetical protein DCZ01_05800 [Elusimicrobia bacterium]|nr:MAG: hypothetical protein A2X37_11230 [Elusimicrobia bacterium GWA2_66_18]OGR70934.1 MAG: hypothetical protein A2X40_07295 [Elusimicrobia bacterium GWC2_65_9]HAZ08032.1 hypothetical protein [Elusimicrobiota bacterium]
METPLDWLNARTFAVIAALSAAVFAADLLQEYPRRWHRSWRYPPQTEKSILGRDIVGDLEARKSLRLKTLHRDVSAEIAIAREEGFEVDKIQRAADSALGLDSPRYRAAAMERLQKLRLAIPRKPLKMRVARDEDDPEDFPPPRTKHAAGAQKRP